MENHHAINGKIHYFDWAIFNSKLLVHQRVPEGYVDIHKCYRHNADHNVNDSNLDYNNLDFNDNDYHHVPDLHSGHW